MTAPLKPWDAALVRKWLEHRYEASRLDQAAADRRGYEARDDFDKAADEEWACRALKSADCTNDQAALAARLKKLIGQDEARTVAGMAAVLGERDGMVLREAAQQRATLGIVVPGRRRLGERLGERVLAAKA